MLSNNFFFKIIIISLHIMIQYQVSLFKTNNLYKVTLFQAFLSNTNNFQTSFLPIDGTLVDTTTSGRMNLGEDSTFPRILEPHHMQ